MASYAQTPTFRGYDWFYGMLSGGQQYFSHYDDGTTGYDMTFQRTRECGANCSVVDWGAAGVYSTHLYAQKAVERIAAHDPEKGPMYLYVAFQAVHSPDQVPQSYVDPYNATISDPKRRTFAGMLSCLDEGVGNITAALAAAGLSDSTLVVLLSDNGGPIACSSTVCGDHTGTSNWPLRGGKHSLWEGGVRLTAVVSGPLLPAAVHGTNITGMMHHTDWFPTLLEAAGVTFVPQPGFELHGQSAWRMLTAGAASSRHETLLNIDPAQPAVDSTVPPGQGNAGIIVGEWKLLLGMTGPPWGWSSPNSSAPSSPSAEAWQGDAPPNSAGLNCSAASFSAGTCLPGNDVPGSPRDATSSGQCCNLCSTVGGAVAWTFRVGEQGCYCKQQGPVTAPVQHNVSDCVSSASNWPPLQLWPLGNMTAQLYNITADPWERDDVAALHPDVVARLTDRLAFWGQQAVTPYWWSDSIVDPRADPARRNNSYYPWVVIG